MADIHIEFTPKGKRVLKTVKTVIGRAAALKRRGDVDGAFHLLARAYANQSLRLAALTGIQATTPKEWPEPKATTAELHAS